jgi:hypothetical protein
MNYERQRIKIQAPLMLCPFGISVLKDKKNPNAEPAYSLELQLGADTPKTEAFTEWLKTIDRRVVSDVVANSNAWLKRASLSEKVANDLHNPCVKRYKDPVLCEFTDKYPARCRFKLGKKNGKFVCKIFDQNRQPVDLDSMTPDELNHYGKMNRMRVIFEIGGVWGGAKGFGLTLRASQVMIFPPQKLTGFGFLHDMEDDLIFGDSVDAAPAAPDASDAPAVASVASVASAASAASAEAPVSTPVEVNSDEEEPHSETEEMAPEPAVTEGEAEVAATESEAEPAIIEEEEQPAPKAKGKQPKKAAVTDAKAPKQVTLTKFSKKK